MNLKKLKDNSKDHVLSKKTFKIPTHRNPNKLVLAFFPWRENAPVALPLNGWNERDKELRKKYPIRYFFFHDILDVIDEFFHRTVVRPIKNIKWAMLHRFHPKHQYHFLKPRSLKPGYYDSDIRILHACMDELSEFVEWNEKHKFIEWTSDDAHKHAWAEMKKIYKWWNTNRPKMLKDIDKNLDLWYVSRRGKKGFDVFDNKPSTKSIKLQEKHIKLEELMHKTDEEMLIRLVKIRRFMWV